MEITTPLIGSVAAGYGSQAPQAPEFLYGENEQGLKDASRDFVSILFSYMFSGMRGNPDDQDEEGAAGSLFGGENVGMFLSFLDQEVGKKFADQGGKDMVDALYNQLKGNNVYSSGKNSSPKDISEINVNTSKVSEKDIVNNVTRNVIEKNKVI